MQLKKDLIVTNVTKVKSGGFGKYVTINCYEKEDPGKGDVMYQMSLTVGRNPLSRLMQEMGIEQTDVEVDSRMNLPTGTRVSVEFSEAKTSDIDPNRRYLNHVISVSFQGYVYKDVDMTFQAKSIMFKDWGIVMETKEKEFTEDKFVFFFSDLPFKVSSTMNKFKIVASSDSIRVTGKARVMYSTFMNDDQSEWNVKPKFRFDSRFDDATMAAVVPEIQSIKTMYLNNLKLLSSNDAYVAAVDEMNEAWKIGFVSDRQVIQKVASKKVAMDTALIPSIFFEIAQLKCFYYARSLLGDTSTVYYYMKDGKFKYAVMHDPGGTVMYNGNTTAPRLLVYDAHLSIVYDFVIDPMASMQEVLDRIKNKIEGLFLDLVVPGYGIEFKSKVPVDEMTSREWLPKLIA